MLTWKTVESELLDTGVAYCDADDIFGVYIRNMSSGDLTTSSTPTQAQVDNLIARMTDRVETTTGRAWRDRRVESLGVPVLFGHEQKHAPHRHRRRRGSEMQTRVHVDLRGFVDLPHVHIKPLNSADGDSLEVLEPRNTTDITGNEGRDTGDYVLDGRKGILRPNIDLFTAVGTRIHGPIIDDAKIRITYRYGNTDATTDADGDGISDTVPDDVREATAMLVGATLIETDQYGELLPANTGDSPDLSAAADRLRTNAGTVLDSYRRVGA